jgi:PAS domain S-box-containing protein
MNKFPQTILSTIVAICIPIICLASDVNLKVQVNNNLYPYQTITNDSNFIGFNIDLLNYLLESYDYNIEYIPTDGKQLKDIDIISFAQKQQTPLNFTFIPLNIRLDYFVFLRTNDPFISINELYNKKVIVVKNDAPFNELYNNKTTHIFTVKSYAQALELLSSGVNDCAILPLYVANEVIKSKNIKNLTYITTPFISSELGFCIKSNNTSLITKIKTQLKVLSNSTRYTLIQNEWFKDEIAQSKRKGTGTYIVLLFALIIIAVLIMYIRALHFDIKMNNYYLVHSIDVKKFSPVTIDLDNEIIQKLLALSPTSIFINDNAGNIILSTKEFVDEFKTSKYNLDQLNIYSVFSRNTAEQLKKLDLKLYQQGESVIAQEINLETTDTEPLRWLIKIPIRFKDDNNSYILNVLSNQMLVGSSSLKRMNAEERLTTIINSLPDIIFYKNIDGEYIGANQAFLNFIGREKREVIGKTDYDLFERNRAKKYMDSDGIVFRDQVKWVNESWEKAHNNESILLKSVKIPILNNNHKIYGLVGIGYDRTQQFKTEKELASAKEKAEESDRIKSSFLANMSQEIRTPVNSIIGFTDLLADPDLTYDQRIEIIDLIQSHGHNLIDVIDDIIDISKIEGGQIRLKFTDFDLNLVLKDAYSYANSKKMQINKELLNINFEIGSIEDEYYINSDPFRLKQIFKNLINYGLRYFTTELLSFGYIVHKDNIIVYIKNDGSPINYNKIEAFEDSAINSQVGLSEIEEASDIAFIIAHNIVKMLGGKLLFDQEDEERYTSFYFTLPLVKAKVEEKHVPKSALPTVPSFEGKTILVAEDEETNFILLHSLLKKSNVEVLRAENGEKAINTYKEKKDNIDLILMDIRMPRVNGVEASRKILEFNPQAKIIAQTAYVMAEDKDLYLKIGMKEILSKPIDPTELYYTIGRYLKD